MSDVTNTATPVQDEGNRVILRGQLAEDIIHGYFTFMEKDTPGYDDFVAQFETPDEDFIATPADAWHNWGYYMRIIKRVSDGKLFGYPYNDTVHPHSQGAEFENNAEENGLTVEYGDGYQDVVDGMPYVFLPVEPFTMTGYKLASE